MRRQLWHKIKEALVSVIPVTIIVLLLNLTPLINLSGYEMAVFSISAIFLILGIWGCLDFDSLFTAFHKVCFPGKDNWLFNPSTDQIILVMPQDFFMNCAIFIAVALAVLSIISIVVGIINRKKLKQIEKHIAEI